MNIIDKLLNKLGNILAKKYGIADIKVTEKERKNFKKETGEGNIVFPVFI